MTADASSGPGRPGETVLYSEKLWPSWWLWTAAVVFGASVSVIFFPIDVTFGVLAMILGTALCLFALIITTPQLEITGEVLRVGRARIETEHLGQITAHRAQAAKEQLGPGFDARSYQCIRGWIDAVITAQVIDENDATPYWIFSTRHPEKVLAALGSTQPVREAGVSVSD